MTVVPRKEHPFPGAFGDVSARGVELEISGVDRHEL
jgi:hypothetical protein